MQPSLKNNFSPEQIVSLHKQKLKPDNREFLIVADGLFLPKDIILEAAVDKIIVALDGAADKLAARGIMPDVILGDFDSIKNPERWGILDTFNQINDRSLPYLGRNGVTIVPAKDQDYTDCQKAIKYCDGHAAKVIHIICGIGTDRMDHTLSNIRALKWAHKPHRNIYLHTESQTLQFVTEGQHIIRGTRGQYCGIMAFPAGTFTSTGLLYNGSSYPLRFGSSESTSNQLLNHGSAKIIIEGEALLIMPGILKSQKIYNEKSQFDKMHCLFSESQRVVVSTTISSLKKTFGQDVGAIIEQLRKDHAQLKDDEEVLISLPEQPESTF